MNTKKYTISGGEKHEEQEIPEVKSLLVEWKTKGIVVQTSLIS